MITKRLFGKLDGRDVWAFKLENDALQVTVLEYGATIQSLKVKGVEVVLGYDDLQGYLKGTNYFGATIGRVANRIAGGEVTINNKLYRLDKNDGDNFLHGGFNGFDKRVFDGSIYGEAAVFKMHSGDGDQGFPGALECEVEYRLDGGALCVTYRAVSDKDTLFSPTNHSFFNLSGKCVPVYDTELLINADCFTPADGTLLPTGERRRVDGTVFDFRDFRKIGQSIHADDGQLALVGGYDQNFVLNGSHAAAAQDRTSGIRMDIYSDMPGCQFYTGNFLRGELCRNGVAHKHCGFCLELQYFPNAANTAGFETPLIKAGERVEHFIKYCFSDIEK